VPDAVERLVGTHALRVHESEEPFRPVHAQKTMAAQALGLQRSISKTTARRRISPHQIGEFWIVELVLKPQ
jgi:hypothetical protein